MVKYAVVCWQPYKSGRRPADNQQNTPDWRGKPAEKRTFVSSFPIPSDEPARLAALHRYGLLDTPADPAFDRLTSLAARLFDVPLALVALADEQRHWFKSCQGLIPAELGGSEVARDIAFCTHTILSSDVMVVPDARKDVRFADNPLVTGTPQIRFYAGAPLLSAENRALGAFCLVDFQPRDFSPKQQAVLRELAACVVSEMDMRLVQLQLVESERLYRQMFADFPQPMWILDSQTLQFLAVNEAAIAHYGYTRAELLTRALPHIRPPEPEDIPLLAQEQGDRSAGNGYEGIWQHRKKDGTEIWVQISAHAIEYGGRPARMMIAEDVTERRQAEEALRRSEQKLSRHIHLTPLAAIELATDMTITAWNPAAEAVFGYCSEEAMGQNIIALLVPDDTRAHVEKLRQDGLAQRGGTRSTNFNRTKSGAIILCEWYNTSLVDEAGQVVGFASMAQDVTARETLEADREALLAQTEALLTEALENADHDPLTGLLNHRAFQKCFREEIQAAQAAGKPLALLVMDLDNFKFFNDAYGHAAGDDVLRQVAQALGACRGAADTLARFGGDEFVLLMPGADRAAAERMGVELREALSLVCYRPLDYDSTIPFTFSLGIASRPEDGSGRTELMEAADARLRAAKTGGEDGEALRLRQSMTRAKEGFSMLDALVTAVDNKDRYTRRHSEDVLAYSVQIARRLGLSAREQYTVQVAALLHDVGKIGVPDAILRKPGRLSEQDFEAVKQHPMMGSIIVGAVPGFEETLDAIRHHHERWDGGGYPFGLRGEETPLMARLMAVADAYSAMTTDRPYRKGMHPARARQILDEGAGTQWDPHCVKAFLRG